VKIALLVTSTAQVADELTRRGHVTLFAQAGSRTAALLGPAGR
jgi:hypothetical protein